MPKLETLRFGTLEYNAEDVICLPDGLVGMSNLRNWLMLEMGDDVPMKWFQLLDRGDFGFPVSQGYLFHDNYEIPLVQATLDKLGNQDPDHLTSVVITTIHAGGDRVTGNLLAPLLIDTETRRGVQLTLDDDRFGLQQEINYFKFGLAVQSQTTDDAFPGSVTAEAMCGNGANKREPAGV